MKNLISVLVMTAVSLPVLAEDVIISTGGRGGSYFATGEKLAEIPVEYDYAADSVKSQGSVENIERVAIGVVAVVCCLDLRNHLVSTAGADSQFHVFKQLHHFATHLLPRDSSRQKRACSSGEDD